MAIKLHNVLKTFHRRHTIECVFPAIKALVTPSIRPETNIFISYCLKCPFDVPNTITNMICLPTIVVPELVGHQSVVASIAITLW